jgi:hypothetical protein
MFSSKWIILYYRKFIDESKTFRLKTVQYGTLYPKYVFFHILIGTLITKTIFLLINDIKCQPHRLISICIVREKDRYTPTPVAFVKITDRKGLFQTQSQSYLHQRCQLLYLRGKIYFLIAPQFIITSVGLSHVQSFLSPSQFKCGS